jgi:hypothetical protein
MREIDDPQEAKNNRKPHREHGIEGAIDDAEHKLPE